MRVRPTTAPLKTASLTVALTLLALAGAAAGELRATIRNVKPNQGRLMVALYDSAAAHKADTPWAAHYSTAVGPELLVVFPNLPPGRYGLAAYQDRDGDGRLGTNLLGIPTEPYGFSRMAKASYGPPAFEDFAVTVQDGGVAVTEIRLSD